MLQMSLPTDTSLDNDGFSNQLLKIWIARYLPDLGLIPNHLRDHFAERLNKVTTVAARQKTAHKILDTLAADCDLAAIQAQEFMAKANLPLTLKETREFGLQIREIYWLLMTCYVEDFIFSPIVTTQAAAEEEEGSLRTAQPVHPKD
jgi:hypothetical protein